ncbi:unnamed protein product [Leptidea sinapis]|uniref:Uncharacterized protein n=1 Tax=Leptidea sinapis TaxID=189913 RepID=A0A5E4PXQ3_9NEOP|nr:unnamed protein product [Leptidea sinapis]
MKINKRISRITPSTIDPRKNHLRTRSRAIHCTHEGITNSLLVLLLVFCECDAIHFITGKIKCNIDSKWLLKRHSS